LIQNVKAQCCIKRYLKVKLDYQEKQLGSGILRIIRAYGNECIQISQNFFRLVFPYTEMKKTDSTLLLESEKLNRDQVTPQVTPQIEKLLIMLPSEMTREELQDLMQLKDRKSFSEVYLKPALEAGLIEMTIPDRPNSRLQKYRLTEKGKVAISEG
jgi:ATP-dependent DNA helicase RecG